MNRPIYWLLVSTIPAFAALPPGPEVVAKRCLGCHNNQAKVGGLVLTTGDSAAPRLERIVQRFSADRHEAKLLVNMSTVRT